MRVKPYFAGSVDIETLSTKSNAYILSLSAAIFDIYDLSLVAQYDYIIGPHDSIQEGRLRDNSTIDWWNGLAPNSPSQIAVDIAYGGNGNLIDAIRGYDSMMKAFKQTHRLEIGEIVMACRGPDFDPVILQNARQMLGLGYGQPFREFDSSRTVDRALEIMGVEVSKDHLATLSPGGVFTEHVSICDALQEGLENATFYHQLAKLSGKPYRDYKEVRPQE